MSKVPHSTPATGYKSSLREFFRQTLPPASPPRMRTMPKPAAKPAPVIPTKLGLIVDLFAGGGGASRGVEAAMGRTIAQVRAFLTVYYGGDETGGQKCDVPMKVITAKSRLGLVTVHGVDYQIVDIGLRMLEPEELLRAQFGKYAAGYDLSEAKTKEKKIRLIGNSVCPEMAEVLVKANVSPELTRKAA